MLLRHHSDVIGKNKVVDDEDEEDRQAQGTELVSSNSKWHKNTIALLRSLHNNIGDKFPDKSPKPDEVQFSDLTKGLNRRSSEYIKLFSSSLFSS